MSKNTQPLNVVGDIMEYESGELDQEQTIALFQQLLDTGVLFSLQGHYGRVGQQLLDAGLITR